MILPPVNQHGDIEQGYGTAMWLHDDQRVPRPHRDAEAQPLAAWRGDCDRHLWDVIDSVVEREVEDDASDDGWAVEQEFRARLTCVHCGIIVAWEGVRDGKVRDPRPVNPTPLVAGDLAAQMIHADGGAFGARDWSTWAVHRGTERVGVITWSRGPRGREYFTGRLFAWPDGERVEATTAAGVLKKLARGPQAAVEPQLSTAAP